MFTSLSDAHPAINNLRSAAGPDGIESVSDALFNTGWQAIFFAAPGLHPDDYNESDTETASDLKADALFSDIANPYYRNS